MYRAELTRTADLAVGYAVLTPEVGVTPSGSVVFQLLIETQTGTQLVTEAGVGVTAETTTARISLDNVGRQSGVAIANRGTVSADVVFILQDRFGVEQDRVTETVPAGGHLARMAQELFPTLELGFSGLIEIQSPVPVAPITLQLTLQYAGGVGDDDAAGGGFDPSHNNIAVGVSTHPSLAVGLRPVWCS